MNHDTSPSSRSEHLAEEEFQGFVNEQLSEADRARVFEHLEHCPRCAAEVEGYLELDDANAEWSKADAHAFVSFGDRLADNPPNVLPIWPAISARADNKADGVGAAAPSRSGSSRRGVYIQGGIALIVAAAAFPAIRTPSERPQAMVSERAGGVSADLFCSEPGQGLKTLGPSETACSPQGQLVVKAHPADGRLERVTVVGCAEAYRCRIASESSFTHSAALVLAGPSVQAGEKLRLFVIWSEADISDEELDHAAAAAREQGGGLFESTTLPGLSSWQVVFDVHAPASPSPR
jgi:hypothetical protein